MDYSKEQFIELYRKLKYDGTVKNQKEFAEMLDVTAQHVGLVLNKNKDTTPGLSLQKKAIDKFKLNPAFFVETIENASIASLRTENKNLKSENEDLKKTIEELKTEIIEDKNKIVQLLQKK